MEAAVPFSDGTKNEENGAGKRVGGCSRRAGSDDRGIIKKKHTAPVTNGDSNPNKHQCSCVTGPIPSLMKRVVNKQEKGNLSFFFFYFGEFLPLLGLLVLKSFVWDDDELSIYNPF